MGENSKSEVIDIKLKDEENVSIENINLKYDQFVAWFIFYTMLSFGLRERFCACNVSLLSGADF